MGKALQQTYYWENKFSSIPSDGFPLRITKKQYFEAVRILEDKGVYIPSEDNLKGEDNFKERKFLIEDCFVELNALNELQEGKNTKIIKCFVGGGNHYSLEGLSEKLNLPLPQWHLRK